MTHEELVDAVRDQATLDEAHAERALEASLESFGERLSAGAADELAAQLPERDAAALLRRAGGRAAAGGTVDLAQRVAERAGVSTPDAANLVQATLRAITRAVDRERIDRIRAQLPADLSRLLQRADEGDTSQLRTGA
jgi:uncharacterized protein (DUF2267 family)